VSNTPCLDAFDRIVASCRVSARNAARRNKPTMWAYYLRMAEQLEGEFGDAVQAVREATKRDARYMDGGIAGVALAIVQDADSRCCTLKRDEAANLWALSVYASRILKVWTPGAPQRRRSLKWLRDRAGVEA
jgi:hypothetical protein